MSKLMVIVVPPEYLPRGERKDGYAVVLGDLVLPGHFLWRGDDPEEADRQCAYFSKHYGLKGYPLYMPSRRDARKPDLKLLPGGRS